MGFPEETRDSWLGIHGWLSQAEGEELQRLAEGRRVLEIGAFHGRSTVCMAKVADLVVSVDWHRGGPDIGEQDTLGVFMRSLEEHGVRDKVIPVVCRSELIKPVLGRRFNVVFIDGAHDFDSIKRDWSTACNLLEHGNRIVALHDHGHVKYPDVKRFVDGIRETFHVVDSLAVVKLDA